MTGNPTFLVRSTADGADQRVVVLERSWEVPERRIGSGSFGVKMRLVRR
jgi:hypothetical protein